MGDRIEMTAIEVIQGGLLQIDFYNVDKKWHERCFCQPDKFFGMLGKAMQANHSAWEKQFFESRNDEVVECANEVEDNKIRGAAAIINAMLHDENVPSMVGELANELADLANELSALTRKDVDLRERIRVVVEPAIENGLYETLKRYMEGQRGVVWARLLAEWERWRLKGGEE